MPVWLAGEVGTCGSTNQHGIIDRHHQLAPRIQHTRLRHERWRINMRLRVLLHRDSSSTQHSVSRCFGKTVGRKSFLLIPWPVVDGKDSRKSTWRPLLHRCLLTIWWRTSWASRRWPAVGVLRIHRVLGTRRLCAVVRSALELCPITMGLGGHAQTI